MQLTSKDGNMVVDFYPVKFATGEIHNRLMLKVVTFMGKTQSKRYINKNDFQREVDSRIEGYGYQCNRWIYVSSTVQFCHGMFLLIMITSKAKMLKVIATSAAPHNLTREQKFDVFCRICDNMLAEGRISKANHTRWTNVF